MKKMYDVIVNFSEGEYNDQSVCLGIKDATYVGPMKASGDGNSVAINDTIEIVKKNGNRVFVSPYAYTTIEVRNREK